jgi:hypothetical protein
VAFYVDPSAAVLQAALDDADSPTLARQLRRDLIITIEKGLADRDHAIPRGDLAPIGAQAALSEYRLMSEHVLRSMIDEWSAINWIWHLRRLPDFFAFNELQSTSPYCNAIAEIAASLSEVTPKRVEPIRGIELARFQRLLRLRELVAIIYELHSAIRWAGKGAPITFRAGETPIWSPDASLQHSVALYDRRHTDAPPGPFVGAGSGVRVTIATPPAGSRSIVPILFELGQPIRLPQPYNLVGGHDEVVARFVTGFFDLREVGPLFDVENRGDAIWTTNLPSALALLLTFFSPYFIGTPTKPAPAAALLNVFSVGYEVSLRENVERRLDWALRHMHELDLPVPSDAWPSDATIALEHLERCDGVLWPPRRGRPVFSAGDGAIVIDWSALTRMFLQAVRRVEPGGPAVNVWAASFENEVQSVVDAAGWAPPDELRVLRGRTLRLRGDDITDIDAIGQQDGTALLISCKSYAFNDEYDRGDYGAVRNMRTNAEEAIRDWADVLTTLTTDPVGDNYDLRSIRNLVGIVVCPFVPFLSETLLIAEAAPGLPVICSLDELRGSLT